MTVWVQAGVQPPAGHKAWYPAVFLNNLGADVWFYRINSLKTISEMNEKLINILEMNEILIEI